MRPYEFVLLLVIALTLCVFVIDKRRRPRWIGICAPVTLLIGVAQVLAEGARWQMIPAYTIAGVLSLVWLFQTAGPARPGAAPMAHGRVAKVIATGLAFVGLAVSVALSVALPVFRLPPPTGPYSIGTVVYHWTDEDRAEVFSTNSAARREMIVQIWYPATEPLVTQPAPYVQAADALWAAQARLHGLPSFTLTHLGYVTSNVTQMAPVSNDLTAYPVVIFLEGLTGYRQMNSFQVENLVSQGYIVAAIDQPYVAAMVVLPDGRQVAGLSKDQIDPLIRQSIAPTQAAPLLQGRPFGEGIIPYLAKDVSFVLDQLVTLNGTDPLGRLTGRLDLQSIGVFGVSIGGIVAGEACRTEPRLRTCLVMDAPMTADVVKAGLPQPVMWITRDAANMQAEGWSQADIDQHQATMGAAFEGVQGAGYFVRMPGTFHANLTDAPFLSPLLGWLGVTGPIDPWRAHAIINAYTLAFFDQHLGGRPAPLLDGVIRPYPEVSLERRP